jgi:hypothetical protein
VVGVVVRDLDPFEFAVANRGLDPLNALRVARRIDQADVAARPLEQGGVPGTPRNLTLNPSAAEAGRAHSPMVSASMSSKVPHRCPRAFVSHVSIDASGLITRAAE